MATGFGTKDTSDNGALVGERTPGAPKPKVFATYRPVGRACEGGTCPASCAMASVCYAKEGPTGFRHRHAAARQTFEPDVYLRSLTPGAYVRHCVSGDCVGPDGRSYRRSVSRGHRARPDVKGWHYTHAWLQLGVANWAKSAPRNLNVLASIETPGQAFDAHALGYRAMAATYQVPAANKGMWDQANARAAREYWGPVARELGLRLVICAKQWKHSKVGCVGGGPRGEGCKACLKRGVLVVLAVHGQQAGKRQRIRERS